MSYTKEELTAIINAVARPADFVCMTRDRLRDFLAQYLESAEGLEQLRRMVQDNPEALYREIRLILHMVEEAKYYLDTFTSPDSDTLRRAFADFGERDTIISLLRYHRFISPFAPTAQDTPIEDDPEELPTDIP